MKHKSFDTIQSVFQQYILAQSQHQRHRNRGKCTINTFLFPSPQIGIFTQIQQ